MHQSGYIVLKDAAETLGNCVKSHATSVRGSSVKQVTLQIRISLWRLFTQSWSPVWILLLQIFGLAQMIIPIYNSSS